MSVVGGCAVGKESQGVVNVLAMANLCNDYVLIVMSDMVCDTIVPSTDPVQIRIAMESCTARRSRLGC